MKMNRTSHRVINSRGWPRRRLRFQRAATRILCASNGDNDRVPRGNEPLDFMSRIVSPAGTKGLPAGRKRPQTLFSRFETPTGTKGLKQPRQKTPCLLGDFGATWLAHLCRLRTEPGQKAWTEDPFSTSVLELCSAP
jgi:hypothetical protein